MWAAPFQFSARARRVLAAGALGALAHVTVMWCGFFWLDHGDIEQRYALAPPGEWLQLFQRGFAHTGFYRPLMALSLSVDALWGTPWVFHATNLLWHALATAAVVGAVEALGATGTTALLAGILFGVHPVTDLVVGAISYRADAMIVALILAMLIAHVRGRPILAALCLLAAGLCKETALVVAPALLLAVELGWGKGPWSKRSPALPVTLVMAETAGWLCALLLRLRFAPVWRATLPPLSPGDWVGTRLASVLKSAAVLTWPVDRFICDAFPVSALGSWRALGGVAVLGALGFLAWRRRGPALLLAITLAPSLQGIAAPRFWSPHYLYFPLVFVAWLVAERLAAWKRAGLVAGGLAATCLSLLSLADGRRYLSNETMFTPEVNQNAQCLEAQFYLAEGLRARGDFNGAAAAYQAAQATDSRVLAYVDAYAAAQNLGVTRLLQKRPQDAEAAFLQALQRVSDPADRRYLLINLGTAAFHAKEYARVLEYLAGEAEQPAPLLDALYMSAVALHELGQDDEALQMLARARSLDPLPAKMNGP